MITFISPEEKETIEINKNALQLEIKTLTDKKRKLEKDKEIKNIYLESVREEIELNNRKVSLDQRIHALGNDKKVYDLHQSVIHLAPDMQSLTIAQKDLKSEIEHFEKYKREIETGKVLMEESIATMTLFTGVEIVGSNFMQEMARFEKLINNYDNQLSQLIEKGNEARSKINDLLESGKTNIVAQLTHKIQPENAFELIDSRMQEIGTYREFDFKEKQEYKDQLVVQCQSIREYGIIDQNIRKCSGTIEKIIKDKATKKQTSISEELEINKVEVELLRINEELIEKEKIHTKAIREASLEEHRHNLVDGEPCPLCGSEHHPFALHMAYIDAGKAGVVIDKLKDLKIRTEHILREYRRGIDLIAINLENLEKEQVHQLSDLEEWQGKKKIMLQEHSFLDSLNIEKISSEISGRQEKIKEIDTLFQTYEETRLLKRLAGEFKIVKDILEQYLIIKKERDQRYDGQDVHADADKIQNKFTAAKTQFNSGQLLLNKSEDRISMLKESIASLILKLEKEIKTLGFDSIESAQMAILPVAESNRIKSEQKTISDLKVTLSTQKKELEKKKAKIKDLLIPTLSIEEMDLQFTKVDLSIHEISQELGGLNEKLKLDHDNKNQYEAVQRELQILRERTKRYELLNGLIGDSKGAKFSNFAQELTLSRLLALANARLIEMNDRYLLDHEVDVEDLLIIDQYQGNTKRAVKTLSGGESFVISLALALSLSDLASRNVRLESLFIDEGFGTLDPETLDVALSTLEKLRDDSGKTIGIISHVASLKERIQTQIKVRKNAQGYSHLEIVD